jgi:hypothetical protein
MKDGFMLFWQSIGMEKQQEFISLTLKSKAKALQLEIKKGESIMPALLASWRRAGVEICYRRPQLMTAAELIYVKNLYSPTTAESVIS